MILIRPIRIGGNRSATYWTIERSLAERWLSLRVIRARSEWELFRLLRPRDREAARSFVFNAAPYLDGLHERGFIPHLLETWGFPHLGSPAAAVRATRDRASMERVLKIKGIPTWEAPGIRPGVGTRGRTAHRTLFLPPRAQKYFVGIVGSKGRLRFPMETEWAPAFLRAPFLRMARLSSVRDERTMGIVQELADRAFDALGAEDYGAVEILRDRGTFAVIGVDAMPDLGRWSPLSIAAQRSCGIDHGDLIRMIAATSLARQRGARSLRRGLAG